MWFHTLVDTGYPSSTHDRRCPFPLSDGPIPSLYRHPCLDMVGRPGATGHLARQHPEVEVAQILARALVLYSYAARLLSELNGIVKMLARISRDQVVAKAARDEEGIERAKRSPTIARRYCATPPSRPILQKV